MFLIMPEVFLCVLKKEIKSPIKFDQILLAIIHKQIQPGNIWLFGVIDYVIEESFPFIMQPF